MVGLMGPERLAAALTGPRSQPMDPILHTGGPPSSDWPETGEAARQEEETAHVRVREHPSTAAAEPVRAALGPEGRERGHSMNPRCKNVYMYARFGAYIWFNKMCNSGATSGTLPT